MTRVWILCLAFALAPIDALADLRKAIEELDAEVEQLRKAGQVPGVAVGIIEDGKLAFSRGYGYRDLERRLPVTENTVFAVGSVTKSFTAATVAILVDEGKLDWDTPVREYLPDFQLMDEVATKLTTVRDMLCHRTGLPRHDFIRFAVPLTREELMRRLRYLEPSASFRSKYQYQNLMYVAAGYLAGHVAGSTWEKLVEDRLFAPLGMTASSTSVLDMQKQPDFARPYFKQGNRAAEVPFYNYQRFGVGPNGAVNSNVVDLAKYVAFHLNEGRVGEKQIISRRQMAEMHRPQIVINEDSTYGLGWSIRRLEDRKLIEHSGSITGFIAWVGFVPQERVGAIVLANLSNTSLPGTIGPRIVRRLLNGTPPPLPLPKPSATPASRNTAEKPRATTHPLSDFVGEYVHPAIGKVRVEQAGGSLQLVFPALTIPLRHVHYDVFEATGSETRGRYYQFQMNERGEISTLLAPLEPAVPPMVFEKLR
ncbi:MAG: serine hydrolase [Bryobacteraceae bacterium]|nr:serine hydrolase [Bryobacteraceae bacterium]